MALYGQQMGTTQSDEHVGKYCPKCGKPYIARAPETRNDGQIACAAKLEKKFDEEQNSCIFNNPQIVGGEMNRALCLVP